MFCSKSAWLKQYVAVILFDKVNPGKCHDALLIKLVMVDLYRLHIRRCRCIFQWLLISEHSSKTKYFYEFGYTYRLLKEKTAVKAVKLGGGAVSKD